MNKQEYELSVDDAFYRMGVDYRPPVTAKVKAVKAMPVLPEILKQLKANSPLLRAVVYAAVVIYGMSTLDMIVTRWSEVQFAQIQSQEQEQDGGTLAGCATDIECELAEQAALAAVAKERYPKTVASK